MKWRVLMVFAVIILLLAPWSAGQVTTLVTLPADLQGQLDGQAYRIRVPANWNGTLLVYSYGYAEGYNLLVPLTPLGTNTAGPDEQMLLDKGYALAGIRAAGWVTIPGGMAAAGFNMKERIQSQVALTSLFRDMVGQPQRTITWGKSMGGLVALALIENHPGLFDGAVPLCPPAAGTPRMFDQKLDIVVAFKAAFGWKDEWGTPGALRSDLNVMTEVAPYVIQQEIADSAKAKWAWEFLRMVNHIPEDPSFYQPPLNFRYQVIWLAFALLADIERRAGGRAVQNVGRVYSLTQAQIDQLKALGRDPESLLAEMNEEVYSSPITADRNARNYVEHYYNPSGHIRRPVLTLHTTKDAAVIPENEGEYLKLVTDWGNEGLLMQQYTTGITVSGMHVNTHCTFAPAQYLAGIDAMMYWLDTGTRPGASWFPATLGFDPDFVPQAWPW
jgi:pimeloyl-ACP methyl ester carboxylesterase